MWFRVEGLGLIRLCGLGFRVEGYVNRSQILKETVKPELALGSPSQKGPGFRLGFGFRV